MKEIPLTQGKVALVDDEDFEWLSQWKWYYHCGYARRMKGDGSKIQVHMHREIAKTPTGMECDHKDHNTLNNTRKNLRNVNRSQNTMNSSTRSDNELREKCISRYPRGYRVQIYRNGRHVYNKTFHSLEEAKTERDKALLQYHGEYANS